MHTGVYTKMSVRGNAHEGLGFLCKTHHMGPHQYPHEGAHGNLTVLTKMCTKVCLVNFHMSYFHMIRKIPAPIKIKSALPPPQKKTQNTPPKKTRNFMDMRFSCRENAFFQASIKLTHPFPAPELRTNILRTRGSFWHEQHHFVRTRQKQRCATFVWNATKWDALLQNEIG